MTKRVAKKSAARRIPFRIWKQLADRTRGYCAMAALYRFHRLAPSRRDLRFRLATLAWLAPGILKP